MVRGARHFAHRRARRAQQEAGARGGALALRQLLRRKPPGHPVQRDEMNVSANSGLDNAATPLAQSHAVSRRSRTPQPERYTDAQILFIVRSTRPG